MRYIAPKQALFLSLRHNFCLGVGSGEGACWVAREVNSLNASPIFLNCWYLNLEWNGIEAKKKTSSGNNYKEYKCCHSYTTVIHVKISEIQSRYKIAAHTIKGK